MVVTFLITIRPPVLVLSPKLSFDWSTLLSPSLGLSIIFSFLLSNWSLWPLDSFDSSVMIVVMFLIIRFPFWNSPLDSLVVSRFIGKGVVTVTLCFDFSNSTLVVPSSFRRLSCSSVMIVVIFLMIRLPFWNSLSDSIGRSVIGNGALVVRLSFGLFMFWLILLVSKPFFWLFSSSSIMIVTFLIILLLLPLPFWSLVDDSLRSAGLGVLVVVLVDSLLIVFGLSRLL